MNKKLQRGLHGEVSQMFSHVSAKLESEQNTELMKKKIQDWSTDGVWLFRHFLTSFPMSNDVICSILGIENTQRVHMGLTLRKFWESL